MESEATMKEKIKGMESQIITTDSEEYQKLRGDNKKLIQQNLSYEHEIAKLREKIKAMSEQLHKISLDEEIIKNELLKELNDVQKLKSQLNRDTKKVELEKYIRKNLIFRIDLQNEKKKLIKMSLVEEDKTKQDKIAKNVTIDPLSRAQNYKEEQGESPAKANPTKKLRKIQPSNVRTKFTKQIEIVEDENGVIEEESVFKSKQSK